MLLSVQFGPVVCVGILCWKFFYRSIFLKSTLSILLDVLEEVRRSIGRCQARGFHGVGGRRTQMLLFVQLGSVDLPTPSLFHPGLRQDENCFLLSGYAQHASGSPLLRPPASPQTRRPLPFSSNQRRCHPTRIPSENVEKIAVGSAGSDDSGPKASHSAASSQTHPRFRPDLPAGSWTDPLYDGRLAHSPRPLSTKAQTRPRSVP